MKAGVMLPRLAHLATNGKFNMTNMASIPVMLACGLADGAGKPGEAGRGTEGGRLAEA